MWAFLVYDGDWQIICRTTARAWISYVLNPLASLLWLANVAVENAFITKALGNRRTTFETKAVVELGCRHYAHHPTEIKDLAISKRTENIVIVSNGIHAVYER